MTFPDGSWREGRLDADGRGTVADMPRGGGSVQYFEEDHDLQDTTRKWGDPQGTPPFSPASGDAGHTVPSLVGASMTAAIPIAESAGQALGAAALVREAASGGAANVANGDAAALARASLDAVGKPVANSTSNHAAASMPGAAPGLVKTTVSR